MSAIDYNDIEEGIVTLLEADQDIRNSNARVAMEDTPKLGGNDPWVLVYFDRRDPSTEQELTAGQTTRYLLRFSIWVYAQSMESYKAATRQRNDLLRYVETALMRNRTVSGKVETGWLEGGEVVSARDPERGTIMAAETIFVTPVESSTV